MKYIPNFNWDPETGQAICILDNGENTFFGYATCHPDDQDMKSEKTGCEIAFRRAKIKVLCRYREDIKIALRALNQLYYSINKSNNFNENSYENKMLQRQIRLTILDLDTAKEMIATERQNLKEYIEEKEKFYRKTRMRRELAKDN